MSERPDTGSTPKPTEWQAKGSGLEIRVGKYRWHVALASLGGILCAACGVAYEVTARSLESYNSRLSEAEKASVRHEQALALDHALLLEIRAQLARIDARQAEIQVTLMRHGREYP